MNEKDKNKEIMERTNLSTKMLREKANLLKNEYYKERAIDSSIFYRDQKYYSPQEDEIEYTRSTREQKARRSEYVDVVRQIAESVYGDLTMAEIAARWDSCSLKGRKRMLQDLPRWNALTNFYTEILQRLREFEDGTTWGCIGADVTGEFEKFARDGRSAEAAV